MDPSTVKQITKEIQREEKTEDSIVKHTLKDLSATQKAQSRAQKAADKADHTLEKREKYEVSTLKKLNQATLYHDVAVSKVHDAESDAKLKHKQDFKLQQALEAKKVQADSVLEQQKLNKQAREAKLAEIQAGNAAAVIPGAGGGVHA